MNKKKNKIYINELGIRIKMCCASCHFMLNNNSVRMCTLRKERVCSSDLCSQWSCSDGMQKAGIGGGKIKQLAFMRFVLESRKRDTRPLAVLEREWEETHGSIYL